MTDTSIIIEVAKLDGWIREEKTHPRFYTRIVHWIKRIGTFERKIVESELPPYITSRDAIIPVIERHDEVSYCLMHELRMILTDDLGCESPKEINEWDMLTATPKQLCIALLKATGKWKED